MKIWKSFAGEHSAKLRIVGTFKTEDDAQKAATFYNALIDVEDKTKGNNLYFSDELKNLFEEYNFNSFNENDSEQADYFYKFKPNGNEIEVLTDELDIQSIIKVFIRWGAKIEIYSRHDY
jgi:hypothetical protein